MLLPQAVEQYDLVEPVQELGPEMRPHHLHHRGLGLLDRRVVGERGDRLTAEVRGQNDQRIGEVDRAALPIGQPPRSEEHTSELQSLMRNSYAVFCLKKKTKHT